MNKLLQKIILISLIIFAIGCFIYSLQTQKVDFNFANNGKIICVEHRDWGIFSKGDLNCFNISQIGVEQAVIRYNCKILNDEVILTK